MIEAFNGSISPMWSHATEMLNLCIESLGNERFAQETDEYIQREIDDLAETMERVTVICDEIQTGLSRSSNSDISSDSDMSYE